MKLKEYIKYLEAAGYSISVTYDTILGTITVIVRRANYQISGYIHNHNLLILPESERDIAIFNCIKERVKELDTQINNFLEETFYK